MGRINQEEMEKRTKAHLKSLIDLMIQRNKKYSTTDITKKEATQNFLRNAELNKIFRLKELIEEPYGISIHYAIQKIDRLINTILIAHQQSYDRSMVLPPPYLLHAVDKDLKKVISDSVDDAIVYLIITKRILEEMRL